MASIKCPSVSTLRIRPLNTFIRPTVSIRNIRIKESSQVKPNGEHRAGPSEAHAVDKRYDERTLDPQAQNAQSSLNSKPEDRPVYVHGKLYKNGNNGTGGATVDGSEEAAAPSWWDSMKQKMGMNISDNETKYGSGQGNRQHEEYVLV